MLSMGMGLDQISAKLAIERFELDRWLANHPGEIQP